MEPVFTFRAQPALDVRNRELDARRRELATAEWELRTARQLFTEAERPCAPPCGRNAQASSKTWHRVWIDAERACGPCRHGRAALEEVAKAAARSLPKAGSR
jgi:hypothetical protein